MYLMKPGFMCSAFNSSLIGADSLTKSRSFTQSEEYLLFGVFGIFCPTRVTNCLEKIKENIKMRKLNFTLTTDFIFYGEATSRSSSSLVLCIKLFLRLALSPFKTH